MNIRILDVAEEDLLAGVEFYERQETGVGSYFLESLYSDKSAHPAVRHCRRTR